MNFADKFREKYRIALHAARENNKEETLSGLANLYQLFAEQYALNNGDSIVVKAKLSYWKEVFSGYITIIRQNGLGDRRVQKFFGLNEDADIPSLGDILGGKGNVTVPVEQPKFITDGNIDVSGIIAPNEPVVVSPKEMPNEPSARVEASEPEIPQAPNESIAVGRENGGGKDEAVFSPDTLEGFIGQQHIVKVLLKEIAIAKAQGRRYLDNILLFGNPGLGKSTLMRLIANALGVKFEWMDCSQHQTLKALQNFLLKVARENEPVVIAFDEIHMLSTELQSSLLTLLNSRVYISPPDANGTVKRIPIDNFTFIAATTDDNDVIPTIKDRCLRLKFQMVDYTPEELKRIFKNKVASKQLTITDEAIDSCIPRSRGSIRYVNSFVDGLDIALYNDKGVRISNNIDLDVVERYFAERGIDAIGLEKKDIEILRVIESIPSGVVGAETLCARVGLDIKKYLSEYEPYLIKIGFVLKSGRGRSLTADAVRYLKGE